MKRTMDELETAMIQNKIDNNAKYCAKAIEARNASDAASFAIGAVRAARQLGITATEVERQTEPMLRLVTSAYVAEIAQAYGDDAPLQADMLGELWATESEPDFDKLDRYADPQCADCNGMGAVKTCDEWELCNCVNAALLAAKTEPVVVAPVKTGCRFMAEQERLAA